MIRFRVDEENNGEEFWDHVNSYDVIRAAPISDAARDAFTLLMESPSAREITVSEEVARELLDWFDTLPGWHDPDEAPEYAGHPLTWSKE